MNRLIECVPNFSEGRDRKKIDAILDEIRSVQGVTLLDCDPGEATNRTVVTFVGAPEPVGEAAFRAIRKAAELIDMTVQHGEHPRMGATDVCPFVPVTGVPMKECVELARSVGERVGGELGIPVYLYEHAATGEHRRKLADIRKGEYESLELKLGSREMAPDFGPTSFTPRVARSGATVMGARKFLIACNVNLNTSDRMIAREIAMNIRESGRNLRDARGKFVRDEHGTPVMKPGTLKAVNAVGWVIDEYRRAQVSINLTDHHTTPLHEVYEECRRQAEALGSMVTGSEIIGLIPLDAILGAGCFYLGRMGKSTGVPEEEIVRTAIISMGLSEMGEFEPRKKIIEYVVDPGKTPLISMPVRDFVNEVSMDSPAPGGGSVAALSGSLGAALCGMVCNLTCVKPRLDPDRKRELIVTAERAQALQRDLLLAVDRDTTAFNDVLAAMRLPSSTPAESAVREAALQEGLRSAIRVPLQTAEHCLDILPLSLVSSSLGNPKCITDAAVSAIMAHAGVLGAILNVRINLADITDAPYQQEMEERIARMEQRAREGLERVLALVRETMSLGPA